MYLSIYLYLSNKPDYSKKINKQEKPEKRGIKKSLGPVSRFGERFTGPVV